MVNPYLEYPASVEEIAMHDAFFADQSTLNFYGKLPREDVGVVRHRRGFVEWIRSFVKTGGA